MKSLKLIVQSLGFRVYSYVDSQFIANFCEAVKEVNVHGICSFAAKQIKSLRFKV